MTTVSATPACATVRLPFGDRARDYGLLLLFALLTRLLFLAIGAMAADIGGVQPAVEGVPAWLDLAVRYDGNWHLSILVNGYDPTESPVQPGATNFAFFPVYPMAGRALAALLGLHPVAAAALVSNLAFAAALLFNYEYARSAGLDRRTALIAAGFLCLTSSPP